MPTLDLTKLRCLDDTLIQEVSKGESAYALKPLKVSFEFSIEGSKEDVKVHLQNGTTETALLSTGRLMNDLGRMAGYPERILKKIQPRHSAYILGDVFKQDTLLGVYMDDKLIGLTDRELGEGIAVSQLLQQFLGSDESFYVREHTYTAGIRRVFAIHEQPFEITKDDPWYYGVIVERDEIADSRPAFQQFAFRLVCANGMIGSKVSAHSFGTRHLFSKIHAARDILHARIKSLLDMQLVEPQQRFGKLMDEHGFGKGWEDTRLESPTAYSLINAITNEAQTRPDKDNLERFAGHVVDICAKRSSNAIRKILFETISTN